MLKLKTYQENTLAVLRSFLEKSRFTSPETSFQETQEAKGYSKQYKKLIGLEDVPYVCLRLPTGGGKTLLSSYAVSVAADAYLENDFPIVVWLVPTDSIRNQTLETLRNPSHPNREILNKQFDGKVMIFDISDSTEVRPQDLKNNVCVLVGTFATLRVTRTEGRKIYAHNENLETHFLSIPKQDYFELDDNGNVKFSFANLLAFYRPFVVVDEAHNHTSRLSVEVLQRIRPSAIVEFTATPAENSNVLYQVSASELKTEEMIKLPIVLQEHRTWEDAVITAIQTREKLGNIADKEKQYVRPIVLFQAENKDKEVTVDVLRRYLVEQEHIPEHEIAVVTGNQKELDGINLLDSNCPIKYIITIQALKEGWDCSFAYVFCSLAKVQSTKDAEQLLGRVLRMPYAKSRSDHQLNRAYAHVSVNSWSDAVKNLRDNLVNMGFEDVEADTNIIHEQGTLFSEEAFVKPVKEFTVFSEQRPNMSYLNLVLQSESYVEETREGYKTTFKLSTSSDLHEIEKNAPVIFTSLSDREQLIKEISLSSTGRERKLTLSEKGEKIFIPQLCLDFGDGNVEVAEREAFLPEGWNILNAPIELKSLNVVENSQVYEIDIYGTKIKERFIQENETLDLSGTAFNWSETELIYWLNKRLQQVDIPYSAMVEFLRRTLQYLQSTLRIDFAKLVRLRFILEKLLREKISTYRNHAYKDGVQNVLFNQSEVACIDTNEVKVFSEGRYPANTFYRGSFIFTKHFFPVVGHLNNEEIECAKALDMNLNVKTWVRNIERQPEFSFWLPTSTDKFYPDFIAQLIDGRILAVEYKGEHLINDDSREKELIGQLWAKSSNGQCLFYMATKKDSQNRDVRTQINSLLSI